MTITLAAVERLLAAAFIGAPGAQLRDEDRKKALELVGLLAVVDRVLPRSPRRPVRIVDAAAGKGYVGLAIAALLLAPRGQPGEIVAIERDAGRLAQAAAAFAQHAAAARFVAACGDVGDAARWPADVDLVVALHACQAASDEVIVGAARGRARHLLIAPCCVAASLPAAIAATQRADRDGLPRDAEIRRPYVEALVLADRVTTLRAAGYEVTVPAFVAPTITPYNKLIVGRWIGRPG